MFIFVTKYFLMEILRKNNNGKILNLKKWQSIKAKKKKILNSRHYK